VAGIKFRNVTKKFGDTTVVNDVDLDVADGEFVALLGPSGCGKTTVLRMAAGFEKVTGGEIAFDETVVSSLTRHVPAEQRRVGIVFQSYALWPHMTVEGNVGYPLRVAGIRGEEFRRRVESALALVGLSSFGRQRPAELSGGQRQRVALARCLVMEPSVVLLDEPLANLDVHLRASMQEEFTAFHRKTDATMLYITHDQEEAMAMANRIVVMDKGRFVQVAAPKTLYHEPRTPMIANFVGKGALVEALVTGAPNGTRCRIEILGQSVVVRCRKAQKPGPATVCLRPDDLGFGDDGFSGQICRSTYKGGASEIEISPVEASDARLLMTMIDAPARGEAVNVVIHDGWVIPESG
jgi:iron(III) transport system ATP-binding protein